MTAPRYGRAALICGLLAGLVLILASDTAARVWALLEAAR